MTVTPPIPFVGSYGNFHPPPFPAPPGAPMMYAPRPLAMAGSSFSMTGGPPNAMPMGTVPNPKSPKQRTGRWTLDEKILFLYGLRKHGKGRWKKISVYLPNRSLVQIKSHAQKVLQRQDDGENIFRRLDENQARTEMLIGMFHARGGEAAALFHPAPAGKRYRQVKQKSAGPGHDGTGADFIIAASALCQLAGPGELVAEEKKSEDDEGKKQDTENVNENSEGNEPSQHVTL